MPYSLKQAAEATGTSKPTILRAIQKGKVSAIKDENGEWQIDPAELHRVYPPETERTTENETPWNDAQHPDLVNETGALQGVVDRLREQLRAQARDLERTEGERERERQQLTDQIADLRRRLDLEGEERRKLTAVLTAPPPAEKTAETSGGGRGFLGLFRRRL